MAGRTTSLNGFRAPRVVRAAGTRRMVAEIDTSGPADLSVLEVR